MRSVRTLAVLLALPLVGLGLLLAVPDLDGEWQHQPSHFWLVLAAGALTAGLAYATGSAARRRGDARVLLVSLALLTAQGFLGLHALATPGVLLDHPNGGFAVATPVGLLLAAAFAAASASSLPTRSGRALVRHAPLIRGGLLGLMAVWGVLSLTDVPPFDDASLAEHGSLTLVALGTAGVALYAYAVARYAALLRERRSDLLLSFAVAFALLAEAMVAVAFSRNWHASWWLWHLLMLAAFALVARTARQEWHEERFSDLYLDETTSARRDVSVLFADLQGFTSWSEQHDAQDVAAMLNEYFEVAVPPIVSEHGGEVDRIIGDALMVVFNGRGDQPDHPLRAARAALQLQRVTSTIADAHPGWPRFRVGVNTGEAAVGVIGTAGGRTFTAIGDVVNLASRLEGQAPVGGVALGPETVRRLPGATVQVLGEVQVKGREESVVVHRLLDV